MLYDDLTARENLRFYGTLYGLASIDNRIDQVIGDVDLTGREDDLVRTFSRGMKQRLAIARAIVHEPDILLLDEPFTGLDTAACQSLASRIHGFREEGRTIVLTTHYMEEAQHLCGRVAIMDAGAIMALDSPSALIRGLSTPYQIWLSTSIPVSTEELAELPSVQGPVSQDGAYYVLRSTDTEATLPAVLQWLNDKNASPLHLEVVSATLEDVFLELTGKDLQD